MPALQSAFYMTNDIMGLYGCSINQIPKLIKRGLIPKPMKFHTGEPRRWLKSVVNDQLGINVDEHYLRQIVREEILKTKIS